jgi:hypothetical protein
MANPFVQAERTVVLVSANLGLVMRLGVERAVSRVVEME